MRRNEIKTASPFKDLFGINQDVLTRIIDDMRQVGFDKSKPLIVWKNNGTSSPILIDGHTRMTAAAVVNIHDVPVIEKEFRDEKEAIQYAIKCQRNRRNLSDAEIIKCATELDKRKDRAKNFEANASKASNGALGKSADETANLVGSSRSKIEKMRTVLDKAPDDIKEAVKSGEMSINKAYNKIMELKRKPMDGKKKLERIVRNLEKRLSKEEIKKLINILREKINR